MKSKDVAISIAFLAISLAIIYSVHDLGAWTPYGPGPALAAYAVAAILAVVGVAIFFGRKQNPETSDNDRPSSKSVMTALALTIFGISLPILGYIISGTLFMVGMLLYVQKVKLKPTLISTAATMLLTYGIFVSWLGVELPRGILG